MDQASQLRHLVLRAAWHRDSDGPPPRTLGVLGAQRGVGTTSITAALGRALVDQGERVVLIDADSVHSALAASCGLEVPSNYDPAIARTDIHEAIVRGPAGMQLVPGIWTDVAAVPSERTLTQLIRQFQQLGRHADLLLLDLGAAHSEIISAWHEAFESLLLVTTTEAPSVMDCYARIKQTLSGYGGRGLQLVVNQAADAAAAQHVATRVDRCCRRFLGFGLNPAAWVASGNVEEGLMPLAAELCRRGQRRAA
jgi:flagellar biosynthesis protein FlhG